MIDQRNHDLMLERAHLAFQRGDLQSARKILERLPPDDDVRDLMAQILAKKEEAKEREESRRSWRWMLNLNTSWKRFWWAFWAVVLITCGGFNLLGGIRNGMANGFATEIMTQVYIGGRYSSRMVDWTRPIYYDVLWGAGIMLIGAAGLLILLKVSRGAADWEGLDDTRDSQSYRFRWW